MNFYLNLNKFRERDKKRPGESRDADRTLMMASGPEPDLLRFKSAAAKHKLLYPVSRFAKIRASGGKFLVSRDRFPVQSGNRSEGHEFNKYFTR